MSPKVRNALLVALAVLGSLLAATAWVWWASSREVVTPLTPLTPLSGSGAAGRALVVYHPGLSDFPDRITGAFAAGLASAGWRVERTTASREAPDDLRRYDLLVVGRRTALVAAMGRRRQLRGVRSNGPATDL